MRYTINPQSLTLIRGTNREIDWWKGWVFPAGCILPNCPGKNWPDRFPKPVWLVSPCGLSRRVFEQGSPCCAMASFVQMWKGSWGVLGLWGVSGQSRSDWFAKLVWPVSPACVRLSPTEAVWSVSETGLTGLGCQQLCRVCFRCVCVLWLLVESCS
jgi:hypothetical protein